MKPVHCIVKHDPAAGTYGDCIRACIATILELPAEKVPHFAHDNAEPFTVYQRVREYLADHKLAPFWINFDGAIPREDLLSMLHQLNPESIFMLYGSFEHGGDHVLVCRGGEIVHDPAWYRSPMTKPGSHGTWTVCVLGRI